MKKVMLVLFAVVALAGCKDRVIWNDNGKIENATENREVWDSEGQMESGERKIWVNKDGEDVVK
ncbi:membrane lipoprotein lipid attachment site-containing protein [Marinobacter sediminum]|uniref:membrane lipoprotein lipid attachment site-containing protein n=1 Tax=Marinobacter sediminum TaxID=256323 RepID=UPI00202E9F47|nr:membrane lipoprotein lipid attachment site-containing protein [Marinobacter sediminum]